MTARNDERDRLRAMRPALEIRSAMTKEIRGFFAARGFIETDTPVRVAAPAMEMHIDAMPSDGAFLRTSPEFHMKRLLAAGYEKIFQLGPCFRAGEKGRLHRPEFAMLEWYRAGADYLDVLADTRELIRALMKNVAGRDWLQWRGLRLEPDEWTVMSVQEAFVQWAGWDPVARHDAARFNEDLVNKVEPELPHDRSVVLKDYPAAEAAFARLSTSKPGVAERWELYIGGIEIANAFSELTDWREQENRFRRCAAMRAAGGEAVYPPDEEFMAAMRSGMPESAGVALGADRLAMLLAGADSLEWVLPFDAV